MTKERMKTVTLFSLFALCILLTMQLMLGLSPMRQTDGSEVAIATEDIDITRIFSPQSYVISFGGGAYTRNYSSQNQQVWTQQAVEDIRQYLETFQMEVISESDWIAYSKRKSIRFQLPFIMSMSMIGDLVNVDIEADGIDQMKVDTILIVNDVHDQIFIGSERRGTYYRLSGVDRVGEYGDFIDSVYMSEVIEYTQTESRFHTMDDLSKVDSSFRVNNDVFPYTAPKLDAVYVKPEVDVFGDASVPRSFASTAFGHSADFVKRMDDVDGSIMYLYGYGERALVLEADGAIEYRERLSGENGEKLLSFKDGLATALGQIARYSLMGDLPDSLYISHYEIVERDGIPVQTFEFTYHIQDYPVYYDHGESTSAIRVELQGERMVYMLRNVRKYREQLSLETIPDPKSFTEIMAINGQTFIDDYVQMNELNPEMYGESVDFDDLVVRMIINDMRGIQLAYFKPTLNDTVSMSYMIPVWVVDIGKTRYYIGLHQGNILRTESR